MDEKRYLSLNGIEAYKRSFLLSNIVWNSIVKWDYFSKNSVGMQFVRSVDSISANIAEGFARHSKKEKIHFYRIAKGSASESLDWNQKCIERQLLTKEQYDLIFAELRELPKLLNILIKYTNEKLSE